MELILKGAISILPAFFGGVVAVFIAVIAFRIKYADEMAAKQDKEECRIMMNRASDDHQGNMEAMVENIKYEIGLLKDEFRKSEAGILSRLDNHGDKIDRAKVSADQALIQVKILLDIMKKNGIRNESRS